MSRLVTLYYKKRSWLKYKTYLSSLGIRFALTQLKAALVEIVRNFDIHVNPKTRSDDQIDDTFFMATLKGGIWLDFKER